MKHLLLVLSLAISSLALEGQTARLECFNCTKLPNDVCLPCLAGTASSEYSQGIMYHQGPNSRVFIRKPYSVSVKGVFITLTDYTGKALTFDGTKTTHGSLTSVLNIINQCNCNIVGGGGPPGSFTISGDTGSGDVTGTLAITTGNAMRSVGANGSLLLDWDLTSASPHSIPYYTTGGTSNVNWRTFATGIVDDPTVGGADQTSLQTVLNNLNSGGGGGNGIYGGSGTVPGDVSTVIASIGASGGGSFKLRTNGSGTITIGDDSGNDNGYLNIDSQVNMRHSSQTNNTYGFVGFNSSNAELGYTSYTSPTIGSKVVAGKDDTYIFNADNVALNAARVVVSENSIIGQVSSSGTFNSSNGFADLVNGFRLDNQRRFWLGSGALSYYMPTTATPSALTPYSISWNGSVPSWVETPSAISKYTVAITGANAGSSLNVISYGAGVTASFASNKLTITIPTGGRILAANWRLVASDVQASADAAGTTNWVQVEFVNSGLNTSLTDFNVPTLQKTAIPASGALSVTNAATMDLDNNPAMSVIGISSGTLTLRIGGLAVGSQGYLLTLNNL